MKELFALGILGLGFILLLIVSMVVLRFIEIVWLVLDRLAERIETKIERDIFKKLW